jgi:hypothetical protein
MKCGGAKGSLIRPLIEALEAAGYQLVDRPRGQHFKMWAPEKPPVFVPAKLDDRKLAKRIAKIAGVQL